MISVTRINKKEYFLNSDLIETMEETPDTVITLRDGKKFVVMEKPEIIIEKIIDYKRRIFGTLPIIINDVEVEKHVET
ncbi:MAG: flagellar FlbD family protein [Bacillota bacterium]